MTADIEKLQAENKRLRAKMAMRGRVIVGLVHDYAECPDSAQCPIDERTEHINNSDCFRCCLKDIMRPKPAQPWAYPQPPRKETT